MNFINLNFLHILLILLSSCDIKDNQIDNQNQCVNLNHCGYNGFEYHGGYSGYNLSKLNVYVSIEIGNPYIPNQLINNEVNTTLDRSKYNQAKIFNEIVNKGDTTVSDICSTTTFKKISFEEFKKTEDTNGIFIKRLKSLYTKKYIYHSTAIVLPNKADIVVSTQVYNHKELILNYCVVRYSISGKRDNFSTIGN